MTNAGQSTDANRILDHSLLRDNSTAEQCLHLQQFGDTTNNNPTCNTVQLSTRVQTKNFTANEHKRQKQPSGYNMFMGWAKQRDAEKGMSHSLLQLREEWYNLPEHIKIDHKKRALLTKQQLKNHS
jgi:hypothetical protein